MSLGNKLVFKVGTVHLYTDCLAYLLPSFDLSVVRRLYSQRSEQFINNKHKY